MTTAVYVHPRILRQSRRTAERLRQEERSAARDRKQAERALALILGTRV